MLIKKEHNSDVFLHEFCLLSEYKLPM